MKQRDRDRSIIQSISHDYETMCQRIKRYDVTEDSFKNDMTFEGEAAFDLVMTPVYRIVEDALHLSDDLMQRHPEFPWDDIRGFRNFVAHGYRNVDRDIAWGVVHEDLPQLVTMLQNDASDPE